MEGGRVIDYQEFLNAKRPVSIERGVTLAPGAVHARPKPHQRDIIEWMVRGGRRACFASFGLGKTCIGLETLRLALAGHGGGVGLVVAPLGVRSEFMDEARLLGLSLTFIRSDAEITGDGLYLTNYESVREGKIDATRITAVLLDEAAILRGFGGTKTFREFMRLFEATPYRFVATATPSPNEHIELLSYAAFLGVMDVGEAKTRFFKRNSEKADQLTLHPHKVEEFWLWVHSWAVFLLTPSDLGYSDEGYALPPVTVNWHPLPTVACDAGTERDGQGLLLRREGMGLTEAARARRATLDRRIAYVASLIAERPGEHCLIWHDLEDERKALETALPDVSSVFGALPLDEREERMRRFADGEATLFASKPVMLGSGPNLQRHCAWSIYAGVDFKFNDFIQSFHRLVRFGQTRPVTVDIVFGEEQRDVVNALKAKWKEYDEQMATMRAIVHRYGLHRGAVAETLQRAMHVTRAEFSGEAFTVALNDTVDETARLAEASVGLIVTSIPFGTQYEYSPNYRDFGHTDDDAHFWRQMGYLSPNLLRALQPGRVMAVHVKDRIRPGGMDNRSFQSASPFHAHAILHFIEAGFVYMGMITIPTDVVRENNQTYRLSYTQQCKDGSRMGVGMPEYVLLFRKAPTDNANGYADVPVEKSKAEYSLARWQVEAHALWKSNGDRLIDPAELVGLPADVVFRAFRGWSWASAHDHEHHVAIAQRLADHGQLPPTFMLLQPQSDHPDIWTDVTRMRTLNGAQEAKGREMHLCPLQFDIVDRLIRRFSNPGDEVYDPFGGLMTVPLRAVELGRRGRAAELSAAYVADGVAYLRAAEEKRATPTLFDLLGESPRDEAA